MTPSSTPWRNVNQPTTMSASPKLHSPRWGRTRNTTASGTMAGTIQKTSTKPSSKKSARYWSASSIEARSCMRSRRAYRIASASVGGEAPQPAPPEHRRRAESDRDPHPLSAQQGQPVDDGAHAVGEEVDGDEVAAQHEEEHQPGVHELHAALDEEGEAPDDE